jgi:DnaJ-class molecular chaperone
MDLNQALKVFGIDEGFFQDKAELKVAFRKLSMIRHPDLGGSDLKFIELQSAYNYLLPKVLETCTTILEKTIEGDLVSDLGKGYSNDILDVGSCDTCHGKGYHVYHGSGHVLGEEDCSICGGVGLFSYPCKYCKGSGKYRKTDQHREIDCRACGGTGRFYPVNKYHDINFKEGVTEQDIDNYILEKDGTCSILEEFLDFNRSRMKKLYRLNRIPGRNKIGISCKNCYGIGRVDVYTEGKPYYSTCFNCGGLGEVKLNLFNPVLRRNVVNGKR